MSGCRPLSQKLAHMVHIGQYAKNCGTNFGNFDCKILGDFFFEILHLNSVCVAAAAAELSRPRGLTSFTSI